MNPNDIAPMVMGVTLFLVTGGVILLRPLSRRLGELLEVMIRERAAPPPAPELTQIRDLLLNVESRLSLLEERQSFAEALLSSRSQGAGAALDHNGTNPSPLEIAPSA
jgi:hypothetical protein